MIYIPNAIYSMRYILFSMGISVICDGCGADVTKVGYATITVESFLGFGIKPATAKQLIYCSNCADKVFKVITDGIAQAHGSSYGSDQQTI